jgi:isoquinoline 1-oxidoreductase beta subunit
LAKDYTNYDGDYEKYPIDTARFRRVLEIATEKAGWGKRKNGNGFGMGLAIHRSFLTYVATVVQVEMGKDGKVKIGRVDTAVDAGTIVNPEMALQQFEGAATFSTSLAFFGEITAKDGVIQQTNFDTYPMARMNASPRETYVHLVPSEAPPAGIGEPGVPPFTPALCNAIFAATGKRVRELPLSKLGLA